MSILKVGWSFACDVFVIQSFFIPLVYSIFKERYSKKGKNSIFTAFDGVSYGNVVVGMCHLFK